MRPSDLRFRAWCDATGVSPQNERSYQAWRAHEASLQPGTKVEIVPPVQGAGKDAEDEGVVVELTDEGVVVKTPLRGNLLIASHGVWVAKAP